MIRKGILLVALFVLTVALGVATFHAEAAPTRIDVVFYNYDDGNSANGNSPWGIPLTSLPVQNGFHLPATEGYLAKEAQYDPFLDETEYGFGYYVNSLWPDMAHWDWDGTYDGPPDGSALPPGTHWHAGKGDRNANPMKALIRAPWTEKCVVAVVGDSGPAPWTGRQFGASSKVFDGLGLPGSHTRGDGKVFNRDNPNPGHAPSPATDPTDYPVIRYDENPYWVEVSWADPSLPPGPLSYCNDFESPVGPEWSNTARGSTPSGRSFLGQFGRETVTLTVTGATPNTAFDLSFDLFMIRSWDGNDTTHGPDIWEVRVKDGQTLLTTTFSNTGQDGHRQAYPDSHPGGDHPAREGAAEVNSLGYSGLSDAKAQRYGDTVYHMRLPLLHASGPLEIEFDSKSDTRVSDESWGLDNVVLAVSSEVATISGSVLSDGTTPAPVVGATVDVCQNGSCTSDRTGVDGEYLVGVLPGQYTVRATPPGGSNLQPGTAVDPVTVSPGESVTVPDIVLAGPTPPPPGTTITSRRTGGGRIPMVYWRDLLTLTTQGCANGVANYEVVQGGNVIRFGIMIELPAGSGMYSGVIEPLVPNHGYAHVEIVINCPSDPPETVDFDIYIDPSGTVVEENGNPIAGASVTLFRSDSDSGPFAEVPDGSGIMSIANRNNPDTTDAGGRFGWDVIAGFYTVRAEAEGCTSPDDPSLGFVETQVLTIPPPVTDLVLVLNCNQPPTADAGPDQTLECTSPAGVVATLEGTGSSDPDGDSLSFSWADTGIVFDDPTSPTPSATFPLGTTTVNLTVTDPGGLSDSDTTGIAVVDTTPPALTVTGSQSLLWPPEHQYEPIDLSVEVSDVCDTAPMVTAVAQSSEPDDANGNGDGATTGDIKVTTAGGDILLSSNDSPAVTFDPVNDHLELRAERAGVGGGRTYTIEFTATDASGNQTTATTTVNVPLDQRDR